MSLRFAVVAAVIASLASAPGSAEAAIVKPKPKRIVASTELSAEPALAGSRIVWAGYDRGDGVEIYTRSRSGRATEAVFDSRVGEYTSAYTVAATRTTIAFYAAAEVFEVRDPEFVAHYFGTLSDDRRTVVPLSACSVRDGCTFVEGRGIDATDRYVAYGPYEVRERAGGEVIVVANTRTGATTLVDVPGVVSWRFDAFRIAGRYIAYRTSDGMIVLVDWKRNEIVRELVPPVRGGNGEVTFDVDRAGRVAVGRGISGGRSAYRGRSAYGLYDTNGRLRMFRPRSAGGPGPVWIENGRIAFIRTDSQDRLLWQVSTLRGRTVAMMRPPDGASAITDFDGDCIVWAGAADADGEQSLHVAATRRVPRDSICR